MKSCYTDRALVDNRNLEVSLSAFISCDCHSRKRMSLCDSRILGKFVACPSLVSCQARKLVKVSSACSKSFLASTDLSIIDVVIS